MALRPAQWKLSASSLESKPPSRLISRKKFPSGSHDLRVDLVARVWMVLSLRRQSDEDPEVPICLDLVGGTGPDPQGSLERRSLSCHHPRRGHPDEPPEGIVPRRQRHRSVSLASSAAVTTASASTSSGGTSASPKPAWPPSSPTAPWSRAESSGVREPWPPSTDSPQPLVRAISAAYVPLAEQLRRRCGGQPDATS